MDRAIDGARGHGPARAGLARVGTVFWPPHVSMWGHVGIHNWWGKNDTFWLANVEIPHIWLKGTGVVAL